MITALCVVLLVTGTFVYVYFQEIRESKIDNLNSIANVIATNSSSALVFDDDQTAKDILEDLRSKKDILAAEIKDKEGNSFAHFSRSGDFEPLKLRSSGGDKHHEFVDDVILVSQNINFDGEHIGYVVLMANTDDLNDYLIKRINIAGLVAIIGIMLAFLLANLLQKYISKPIYKLLNVMNEVKNTATYSIRAQVNSRDEIGNLSSVFNEMLNEIEKKNQLLSENNNLLQEKVKERTNELEINNEQLRLKNDEIVMAKIQAEQSKAVKELFLANMSHEIRTPLNAIIGFQQLLKQTALNETQMEYVEAIDFAGKNLLTLVNDILDLSKIESGKLQFEDAEFELNQHINRVIELLQQRAKDKGIQIFSHPDARIPSIVVGDSTRFNQIMLNLIGNAIKFTDSGQIDISSNLIRLDENEIWCSFEIKDTGIGIAERKLNRIFESFTQAGTDTTRLYGGTGLGLTICKHLVEEFGGSIKVSSRVGIGSIFTFDVHFKRSTKENQSTTAMEIEQTPQITHRLRILLAEDVLINQRLMQRMAKTWDYDLEIAQNGQEAVEKMKLDNFDIVLMDIQMPIMNGFEATRAIRKMKSKHKNKVPIIALTAHASNAEAEKCLDLGMNAYVTKPFEQGHLLDTIHRLVLGNEQQKNSAEETAEEENEPDFISLSTIQSHAQGDQEYVKEMVEMYIDNMPHYAEELKEHIASEDIDNIYAVVHMMKSPIVLFEVNDIIAIIKRMEVAYKDNVIGKQWYDDAEKIVELVSKSVELMKEEHKFL